MMLRTKIDPAYPSLVVVYMPEGTNSCEYKLYVDDDDVGYVQDGTWSQKIVRGKKEAKPEAVPFTGPNAYWASPLVRHTTNDWKEVGSPWYADRVMHERKQAKQAKQEKEQQTVEEATTLTFFVKPNRKYFLFVTSGTTSWFAFFQHPGGDSAVEAKDEAKDSEATTASQQAEQSKPDVKKEHQMQDVSCCTCMICRAKPLGDDMHSSSISGPYGCSQGRWSGIAAPIQDTTELDDVENIKNTVFAPPECVDMPGHLQKWLAETIDPKQKSIIESLGKPESELEAYYRLCGYDPSKTLKLDKMTPFKEIELTGQEIADIVKTEKAETKAEETLPIPEASQVSEYHQCIPMLESVFVPSEAVVEVQTPPMQDEPTLVTAEGIMGKLQQEIPAQDPETTPETTPDCDPKESPKPVKRPIIAQLLQRYEEKVLERSYGGAVGSKESKSDP